MEKVSIDKSLLSSLVMVAVISETAVGEAKKASGGDPIYAGLLDAIERTLDWYDNAATRESELPDRFQMAEQMLVPRHIFDKLHAGIAATAKRESRT